MLMTHRSPSIAPRILLTRQMKYMYKYKWPVASMTKYTIVIIILRVIGSQKHKNYAEIIGEEQAYSLLCQYCMSVYLQACFTALAILVRKSFL